MRVKTKENNSISEKICSLAFIVSEDIKDFRNRLVENSGYVLDPSILHARLIKRLVNELLELE